MDIILESITPLMWFLGVLGAISGMIMGGKCQGDAVQRSGGALIGAVIGFIVGLIIGLLLPFTLEALPGRGRD